MKDNEYPISNKEYPTDEGKMKGKKSEVRSQNKAKTVEEESRNTE